MWRILVHLKPLMMLGTHIGKNQISVNFSDIRSTVAVIDGPIHMSTYYVPGIWHGTFFSVPHLISIVTVCKFDGFVITSLFRRKLIRWKVKWLAQGYTARNSEEGT